MEDNSDKIILHFIFFHTNLNILLLHEIVFTLYLYLRLFFRELNKKKEILIISKFAVNYFMDFHHFQSFFTFFPNKSF